MSQPNLSNMDPKEKSIENPEHWINQNYLT